MFTKKRKIIILTFIIIIIGILLLLLGILMLNSNKQTTTTNYEETKYDLESIGAVNMCDTDSCLVAATLTFYNIIYETDNEELKKAVDNINAETLQYYNSVLNSDVSDSSCAVYQADLNHSLRVMTDYYVYTKGRYDSIAVNRVVSNICTREETYSQVEAYIYDKEDKKIITQQEFKRALEITDEKIKAAVSKNIEASNQFANTDMTIDDVDLSDIVLFYNNEGNLYVSYKVTKDNSYQVALIES